MGKLTEPFFFSFKRIVILLLRGKESEPLRGSYVFKEEMYVLATKKMIAESIVDYA